jgi:hypothetical protein
LLVWLGLFPERKLKKTHCLPFSIIHLRHRFWATVAPVGAEVVGLKIFPAALSIRWTVLVPHCTFAEPIGLQLQTIGRDYLPSRADIHWLDVYWSRFLYVASKSVEYWRA